MKEKLRAGLIILGAVIVWLLFTMFMGMPGG